MAFSYLATNRQEPPASTVSSVGLLVTLGAPAAGAGAPPPEEPPEAAVTVSLAVPVFTLPALLEKRQ